MASADKLDIDGSKDYEKLFEEDEVIMYSDKHQKVNKLGRKQEKILVLTTTNIYILKKKKVYRKIKIVNVGAVILSSKNDTDFVVHIPKEYDSKFRVDSRKEFVDLLQLRFANLDKENTLKIYAVLENLKMYTTTIKDQRYGLIKLPEESYRLKKIEIAGSKSYDESKELEDKLEKASKDFEDTEASTDDNFSALDGNEIVNSRDSVKNLDINLLEDEKGFDSDDLIEDESSLLYSSSKYESKINLDDFDIINILGKGAFGKVYLTRLKINKKLYAVKTIRKDVIIETDQIEAISLERDILLKTEHPFLVSMDFVFQSELRLYFVMPFIQGGELYKHFLSNKRFPEEVVKFYSIQLALAIGHLHSQGIIHRDLKLENILIDKDGYLKIIDYGLAKILQEDETTSTICGTPEYLAPEMVNQEGHDKNVDWWALGIIIYEMLIGVTPFYNRNRAHMMKKIKKSKIVFPHKKKYGIEYSDEIKELITRLLDKEKSTRLGSIDDINEILDHEWFKGIDTNHVMEKMIVPPFTPEVKGDDDTSYYHDVEESISLKDTYIPKDAADKIKSYNSEFTGFEKKKNIIRKK